MLRLLKSLVKRLGTILANRLSPPGGASLRYTKFHSQFGEDRFVFERLSPPARGVFVDVGAGDPTHLSNTYFFEKNGWSGVCVDADPTHCKLLREVRSDVEFAAISPAEGEVDFQCSLLPAYSRIVPAGGSGRRGGFLITRTVKVPSLRLETVLAKRGIGKVDLLSIDVEGAEIDVWETFAYEKHRPTVVIVEHRAGLRDNSKKLLAHFSRLPYRLVHTTPTNCIFRSD